MLSLAEIKAAGHENADYVGFGVSHEPMIASTGARRPLIPL